VLVFSIGVEPSLHVLFLRKPGDIAKRNVKIMSF